MLSQDRHQNDCLTPMSLGPSHWQDHCLVRPAEALVLPGPGTVRYRLGGPFPVPTKENEGLPSWPDDFLAMNLLPRQEGRGPSLLRLPSLPLRGHHLLDLLPPQQRLPDPACAQGGWGSALSVPPRPGQGPHSRVLSS